MKYAGNYFPFIILSLLLYGLFFYFNSSSPIETSLTKTDTQPIQMQTNALSEAQVTVPTIPLTAKELEIQLLNKAVTAEKNKLNEQRKANAEIAKQQYRKSLEKHDVNADALLKEHIFNDELAAQQKAINEKRATKKIARQAERERRKQEALNPASIASILPITAPVPDTKKSPAKFTVKAPPSEDPIETMRAMKPRFTAKAPPKEDIIESTKQSTTVPLAKYEAVKAPEAEIVSPITTKTVAQEIMEANAPNTKANVPATEIESQPAAIIKPAAAETSTLTKSPKIKRVFKPKPAPFVIEDSDENIKEDNADEAIGEEIESVKEAPEA